MKWLTVNINPPKLDCHIVARTENWLSAGYSVDSFYFSSVSMEEESAADYLDNHGYIEWLELPQ